MPSPTLLPQRLAVLFSPGLVLCACAAAPTPVPLLLQVPAGQRLFLEAKAEGVQIYACEADAFGHHVWTFKGPEATLRDAEGRPLGHHYAGPTWESNDGSKVVGKVAASVPSPDPAAVPWLLLSATSSSGPGVMTRVASIQRVDTSGGKPQGADCAPSSAGQALRVPYQARYLFYDAGAP